MNEIPSVDEMRDKPNEDHERIHKALLTSLTADGTHIGVGGDVNGYVSTYRDRWSDKGWRCRVTSYDSIEITHLQGGWRGDDE